MTTPPNTGGEYRAIQFMRIIYGSSGLIFIFSIKGVFLSDKIMKNSKYFRKISLFKGWFLVLLSGLLFDLLYNNEIEILKFVDVIWLQSWVCCGIV